MTRVAAPGCRLGHSFLRLQNSSRVSFRHDPSRTSKDSAHPPKTQRCEHKIFYTPRRRNHRLVVNNSRFLIVPSVKVKCLASWVLARVEKRLAQDWQQGYGYLPVLLETYVERGRFAGTCYRAANWTWVGVSTGQGRRGGGASIKDVYMRPLAETWQQSLCREGDGKIRIGPAALPPEPRDRTRAAVGGA